MMLKKDNFAEFGEVLYCDLILPHKSMKSTKLGLGALRRRVQEIKNDLKAIKYEHDYYDFGTNEDVAEWFQSFPIENLYDSLAMDHNARTKIGLIELLHKYNLRKLFSKKVDELEDAERDLYVARVEKVLKKINKIK